LGAVAAPAFCGIRDASKMAMAAQETIFIFTALIIRKIPRCSEFGLQLPWASEDSQDNPDLPS